MAKIRITENDLKQIIRESVAETMDERFLGINGREDLNNKWGYTWDDTLSAKQNRAARREKRDAIKNAGARDNTEYQQMQDASKYKSQAAALKKTVDQLNAKIQELESQNSTLATQNAALQKQVSMYKPAYEQQKAGMSNTGEKLNQLGAQNFVAQNSNNGLVGQRPRQIPRQPNGQLKPGVYAA